MNKDGLGHSFPVVLTEEQRQNLSMFIDPVTKFFEVHIYTKIWLFFLCFPPLNSNVFFGE